MHRSRLTRMPRRVGIAFALGATMGQAFALPGTLEPNHPRVYATRSDLAKLKAAIPIQQELPDQGEITLTITPAVKVSGDGLDTVVFGRYSNAQNSLFVRHLDKEDTDGFAKLQVGMQAKGEASYAAAIGINLPVGVPTTLTFVYDGRVGSAKIKVGNDPFKNFSVINPTMMGWKPSADGLAMTGRKGDVTTNVAVKNIDGTLKWQLDKVDYVLSRSYLHLLTSARTVAANINACDTEPVNYCDIGSAPRGDVMNAVRPLSLAYQLSKDPSLLAAGRKYAKRITSFDAPGAGGEFAMSARVMGLGVLYDWLHDDLSEDEKADMRRVIKTTIGTRVSDKADLIAMMCGAKPFDTAAFDCDEKDGVPVDISRYYLTGHHASAMASVAVALLAIADVDPQVTALLDRIYLHMKDGILPARDYVSLDGGQHTLFGYNNIAGELIERLITWRRALQSETLLPTRFETNAAQPYIFGLRGDKRFPASGDRVEVVPGNGHLGYMFLSNWLHGSGAAGTFYADHVKSTRSEDSPQAVWDKLYFPNLPATTSPISDLPLSAHFRRAGNVLIRDTWNFADATLLDFKSSSFISENHQHLDQNSFSLYRKAPLIVDSGAYDGYGNDSYHWRNYYQRTVAHNTVIVFDADEKFKYGTDSLSNDGGQWYGDLHHYPTLAEIQPGKSHALGGVTHYDEHQGGDYAFVTGDATKAYSNTKMMESDGFVRSIFYLRPPVFGYDSQSADPVVVVFDRVRTKKGLIARSLLHSATRPATNLDQGYQGTCHYKVPESPSNIPLTIRNGGGMVTVEPLLPQNAQVYLVGGHTVENSYIEQFPAREKTTENYTDCRFAVPTETATEWWTGASTAATWRNYWHKSKLDYTDTGDHGAWRIEISPRSADAQQLFLNVLRVADNDEGSGSPAIHESTLLANGSVGNTVALSIHGTTVAFSTIPNATSLSWTTQGSTEGRILAAGLLPARKFVKEVAGARISFRAAENGSFSSSCNGVIDTARALVDVADCTR